MLSEVPGGMPPPSFVQLKMVDISLLLYPLQSMATCPAIMVRKMHGFLNWMQLEIYNGSAVLGEAARILQQQSSPLVAVISSRVTLPLPTMV
jgi:hypothetical protein